MPANPNLTPEQELARRTRRGFIGLAAGAGVVTAAGAWIGGGAHAEGDIPPALRSVLGFNEKVVRSAVYDSGHLAPTFPASAIGNIKVNGIEGMEDYVELDGYQVNLRPYGAAPPLKLTPQDVMALPKHEEIIEFKCVEGWSTVTQFAGARLSDFTARFCPGSERAAFIGMKTPDEKYYVSIDMPSALHPQTLLAWEMNSAPLNDDHGAPLRLVIPVKYGIKNIKRIGSIEYTDTRPADYWQERGYDWYSGL